MSSTTKTFSFGTTSAPTLAWTTEGGSWDGNTGGGSGLTVGGDTGGDTLGSESTAALSMSRSGRNLSNGTPYWEWTGTWEDLGVPSSSTISDVDLDFDWSCKTYTTGASSTVGPSELRDSSGSTLTGTFATSSAYSATTSWAQKNGTALSGLSDASSTTIKLRINAVPKTGNNNSAVNKLDIDRVIVTVTYTAAAPWSGDAYDSTITAETGLVLYLPCDETSGTTIHDRSGSSLDYTTSGTVTVNQTGLLAAVSSSPCALFGGGYLTRATAAALHPADVFSLELWVQRTSVGGGVTSYAFYDPGANEQNLFFKPADTLCIRKDSVADVFETTAAFTSTTTVYHIVFTKNGSSGVHIYVNGVDQAGTASADQTFASGATTVPLLMAASGGAAAFPGYAQKIALYNVALTSTQVSNHYTAGTTGSAAVRPPALTLPVIEAVHRSYSW